MPPSAEQGAAPFVPEDRTLPVLQEAVQHCRGCDLYQNATQAVFGELETGAKAKKPRVAIMMIGEQPGDQEDKQGRPFVGPAGRLLDKCLEEVKIDRRKVYVTNTVKHFRWEPRGKLRIHKKPSMKEIHACRPWLNAELEAVRPEVIVCLELWPRSLCLAQVSKSPNLTERFNRPKASRRSSPLCILPRSCAPVQMKTVSGTPKSSSATYNRSPTS